MQTPNQNQYPSQLMQGPFIGRYLSEDRNLFMNGDMYIDQANEGASVSLVSGSPSYIVDGAKVLLNQSSAVVSAQQVASTLAGFAKFLKITTTTGNAVGAGDYLVIKMPIEGPAIRFLGLGGASAAYVSLQFWTKGSVASQVLSFALQNSAGDRVYIGTFVPSSTQYRQHFFPAIPLDVAGTWLTAAGQIGLQLIVTVASGATQQSSTLNAFQASAAFAANTQTNGHLTTNGATFQIGGVYLEPGPVCTPYPLLQYEAQLDKCRRQYRKSFAPGTAPAQSAGIGNSVTVKNPIATGDPAVMVPFEPTMASSPTITTYNPSAANANWRNITAGADATVSVDPASTKGPNGVFLATSGTVANLGDVLAIHYTADARL